MRLVCRYNDMMIIVCEMSRRWYRDGHYTVDSSQRQCNVSIVLDHNKFYFLSLMVTKLYQLPATIRTQYLSDLHGHLFEQTAAVNGLLDHKQSLDSKDTEDCPQQREKDSGRRAYW